MKKKIKLFSFVMKYDISHNDLSSFSEFNLYIEVDKSKVSIFIN
jgi:hypothetical protein